MDSNNKRPVIIGVDGGGTKVTAGIIEKHQDIFSLNKSFSNRHYLENPDFNFGFSPVSMSNQLRELQANEIKLTTAEIAQSKPIINSFRDVILHLNINSPVLIGIGMVGLKTPDKRGIGAMANGPRMPKFCAHLEQLLQDANVGLKYPIRQLGSDADYCGIGEEYGDGGMFKDVRNAYYLGGGTGAADALKLNGKLIPFDDAKSWIAKTWEIKNDQNISLETYASVGGIQSLYSNYAKIPLRKLQKDSVYADIIFSRSLDNEEAALLTFSEVSTYLAKLIFERLETIYSGWQNRYEFLDPDRDNLKVNHPYRKTLLDRIIIGQRLGKLLDKSREPMLLWEPFQRDLYNNIEQSKTLTLEAKDHYLEENNLKKNLIMISKLDHAPVLGAGIAATHKIHH